MPRDKDGFFDLKIEFYGCSDVMDEWKCQDSKRDDGFPYIRFKCIK